MCLEVRNSQDVWLTVLRFIAKTVDPASKAVAALASAQARLQHADMRWATVCGLPHAPSDLRWRRALTHQHVHADTS